MFKSCKFRQKRINAGGYVLVRANTSSEFIVEQCANQVFSSFFGRAVPSTSVYAAVCRKEDGDVVIVVSSERTGQILLEYDRRWEIETRVRQPEDAPVQA